MNAVPLALFTVMSSRWFYVFTFLAPTHPLLHLDFHYPAVPGILGIFIFWVTSNSLHPSFWRRVDRACQIIGQPNPNNKYVEPQRLVVIQSPRFDMKEKVLRGVRKEQYQKADTRNSKILERANLEF